MSNTDITQEQAQAFMRELTELSKKHGIWLGHHHECLVATKTDKIQYDWWLEVGGPNGDCLAITEEYIE